MRNPHAPTYQPTQPVKRGAPWLALAAVDFALSVATLVVFGLFGGAFLLLALNGFSEAEGLRIITVYVLLIAAGNALVASLVNWLILRRRAGVGGRVSPWPVFVPPVAITAVLLLVGPPLAFLLITLVFSR